jgi:hypothetical protein
MAHGEGYSSETNSGNGKKGLQLLGRLDEAASFCTCCCLSGGFFFCVLAIWAFVWASKVQYDGYRIYCDEP